MSRRKALITGISGQDGSYLADFLLAKSYEVHGIVRRSSSPKLDRIQHLLDHADLYLHQADLLDQAALSRVVSAVLPDELYNLAAQSFVATSWEQPVATAEFTGVGVLRILEAIRATSHPIRFYQASSSEMFGKVQETPQRETTPLYPRSPYGAAKCFGHWLTVNYRESYNMFAVSGILYNHESPRRGVEFVTRKISRGAALIRRTLDRGRTPQKLKLGNLQAKRDWGFAGDYVEAMWLMLQQDTPDDYVIGTGKCHSVEEFVDLAFRAVHLDWHDYVELDQKLIRPAEVDLLLSDPGKAKRQLGWEAKVDLHGLVAMMVEADLHNLDIEHYGAHWA